DTVSNNAPAYSTNHEYVEVVAKKRSAVESRREMFRETRPGYQEVQEVVERLSADFAPSHEIESAISALYKQHRDQYREEAQAIGIDPKEADKADPWKGLYPYKHVEYRDPDGRLVSDEAASEKFARAWVWREVEPSMPSGKQA